MKMRTALLSLAFIAVAAINASAQAPAPSQSRRAGYLSDSEIPDLKRLMPAAPVHDDARDVADRTIFWTTRALEGSPRWDIAKNDDNVSNAGLMKAFSCALGVSVNSQNAPRTTSLVRRAFADTNGAVGPLKNLFQRKRPFLVQEGTICIARSPGLTSSFDYPSGHSTAGWALGLILSSLAPERAPEILFRARAFGESRVVCGVHNASAVEAGRFVATTVFAALSGSLEFQADLNLAKEEIQALQRDHPPDPPVVSQACRAEEAALQKRPF